MVMLATVAPTPLILFCARMLYSTFISAPTRVWVFPLGYEYNIVFKATSHVISIVCDTHRRPST